MNTTPFTDKMSELIWRKKNEIGHATGRFPMLHLYLGRRQKDELYRSQQLCLSRSGAEFFNRPTTFEDCPIHWVMEDDHLNIAEIAEI